MNECDKMMSCLGFDESSVKNYGNAIPFTSRKLDIMSRINQLNQASRETARNSDLYALFYILSIAFTVMVMRFFVFAQSGDSTIHHYCFDQRRDPLFPTTPKQFNGHVVFNFCINLCRNRSDDLSFEK